MSYLVCALIFFSPPASVFADKEISEILDKSVNLQGYPEAKSITQKNKVIILQNKNVIILKNRTVTTIKKLPEIKPKIEIKKTIFPEIKYFPPQKNKTNILLRTSRINVVCYLNCYTQQLP